MNSMEVVVPYFYGPVELRTLVHDGSPWFCAVDVCTVLGYANSRKAVSDNCREAGVTTSDIRSGGQVRSLTFIDEGNLYRLMIKSRKSEARRFETWICDEVLPSIRKHGAYVMPAEQPGEPSAPVSANVEADQIVSAGRVFRSLYTVGRCMGLARRLAATRANQAAERATGVDLAAELNATQWLAAPDLPEPLRKQYELQQRVRSHLEANNWPEGFTSSQLIQALGLVDDKGTQMAIGRFLGLIGYKRVRMAADRPNGLRPWGYVLSAGVPGALRLAG